VDRHAGDRTITDANGRQSPGTGGRDAERMQSASDGRWLTAMLIEAEPNDTSTQQPASNRAGSTQRTTWLVVALGISVLGLVGLYVGRDRASQMSGLNFRRLPDLLPEVAAIAIFAVTYLVVAIGRLPGFWLDRTGAALVGASLMVAVGIIPLEEAPKAIDFDTIILLLGVMIVVANLRLSGFFRVVNGWVVTRARYPVVLLTAIILVSGVLSAFLVNDTICLVLTPLVLDLVTRLSSGVTLSPTSWRSPWHRTWAARRRSQAIRRT
jgi:di/tricarboxylate transporter